MADGSGPRRLDRGWFVWQRSTVDAYLAEHKLAGDDANLFCRLVAEADDRTGTVPADLAGIAEHLGYPERSFRRRLAQLERARVIVVNRSNAPGRGGIVLVDYARLNPRSRHARRQESGQSGRTPAESPAKSPAKSPANMADESGQYGRTHEHESAVSPGESGQSGRTLTEEDQEDQEDAMTSPLEEEEVRGSDPLPLEEQLDDDAGDQVPTLEARFARYITTPPGRPEPDEIAEAVARLVTDYDAEAVSAWLAMLDPRARWRYPRQAEEVARAEIPTLGLVDRTGWTVQPERPPLW